MHARPQPFLGDILSFFGVPQGTVDKVEEAEATIVTPASIKSAVEAQKESLQYIANFIKGLPFFGGRAVANPLATFLSGVITSLKNTDSVSQTPAATSMLDTVNHIISNMDPAQDPLNGFLQQTSSIGSSFAGGMMEVIPDLIGLIGQSIFPTQARMSFDSVLTDITNLFNGIINSLSQVLTGAMGLPQQVVNSAMSDVQAVVNNITQIKSTKPGTDGVFDIAEQAIGSAIMIIDTLNGTVHKLTNPIIGTLTTQLANGINNVNTQLDARINNALSTLANGSMKNCSAPLTNSITVASTGLNAAITNCLYTEVNTLTQPLQAAKDALNATTQALIYANRVVNSCMAFNLWDCGWNVAPAISQLMAMTANYAVIPAQATLIYSNVQTRLPTCIATDSLKVVSAATAAATPLLTCML